MKSGQGRKRDLLFPIVIQHCVDKAMRERKVLSLLERKKKNCL